MHRVAFLAVCLLGAAAALSLLGRSISERSTPTTPPAPPPPPAPGGTPAFVVLSSLHKVRPDRPLPPGGDAVELVALRGECEAGQIALRSDTPLPALRASIEGTLGAGIDARLYRVGHVHLRRPSGPEGEAGLWPDPLIPERDAYDHQIRNAFPFDLPAGQSLAVLADLCVDRKAAPGMREAALALRWEGGSLRVPIRFQVLEAAIPATASFPVTFGFSARRASLGHFGHIVEGDALIDLGHRYRSELLRHRISAHGGTMDPPPFRQEGERVELDFAAYDKELGPFLEGTALPSGARATSTELRTHPALPDDGARIAYWRAIVAHHRQKGWEALLFDYAKDEPDEADLPAVAEKARLIRRADPTIRVLLTASFVPDLAELVDIWTPNLNCLWVKRHPAEYCKWRHDLAAYAPSRARGARLWWYQSCSSHGCGEGMPSTDDASYFLGWPSYVIDAPGPRARLMAWLAFREGIEGELYWDTVYAYAPEGEAKDPWEGGALFAFGGNGDGTLFYPGTPAAIGGSSHVPVASLRLLHIRDGLEDFELLRRLAEKPGGREAIHRAMEELAPRVHQVRATPESLEKARRSLLGALGPLEKEGEKE